MNYIDFKTAVIAKELGFKEYSDMNWFLKDAISYHLNHYEDHTKGECYHRDTMVNEWEDNTFIPAPTLYDYQKWLREKHDIDVYVLPNGSRDKTVTKRLYHPVAWIKDEYQTEMKSKYFYEEALSEGLYQASLILKERKNE